MFLEASNKNLLEFGSSIGIGSLEVQRCFQLPVNITAVRHHVRYTDLEKSSKKIGAEKDILYFIYTNFIKNFVNPSPLYLSVG